MQSKIICTFGEFFPRGNRLHVKGLGCYFQQTSFLVDQTRHPLKIQQYQNPNTEIIRSHGMREGTCITSIWDMTTSTKLSRTLTHNTQWYYLRTSRAYITMHSRGEGKHMWDAATQPSSTYKINWCMHSQQCNHLLPIFFERIDQRWVHIFPLKKCTVPFNRLNTIQLVPLGFHNLYMFYKKVSEPGGLMIGEICGLYLLHLYGVPLK